MSLACLRHQQPAAAGFILKGDLFAGPVPGDHGAHMNGEGFGRHLPGQGAQVADLCEGCRPGCGSGCGFGEGVATVQAQQEEQGDEESGASLCFASRSPGGWRATGSCAHHWLVGGRGGGYKSNPVAQRPTHERPPERGGARRDASNQRWSVHVLGLWPFLPLGAITRSDRVPNMLS